MRPVVGVEVLYFQFKPLPDQAVQIAFDNGVTVRISYKVYISLDKCNEKDV